MLQSTHTTDINSISKDKVLSILQYMLENINTGDESNNIIGKDKVLRVLSYMLQSLHTVNTNGVDKDKVLSILQYMLENINTGDESNTFDNGAWKLVCFKKNSPSHKNKERQYDLYKLADDKLMAELTNKLGIGYFALCYTTRPPTELERYTGSVRSVIQDCNCQIMAFTNKHQPLPQFSGKAGTTDVYLQKTNDKKTFNLIPGHFPVVKEPTQTFSSDQFIQTIDNCLRQSDNKTKELISNCSTFYNSMLKVVYEDLKQIKNTNNYNLADLVVTQFATSNNKMAKTIKSVFNELMGAVATPIIAKLSAEATNTQNNTTPQDQQPNQQPNQQQEQQLINKFETQFKQQLNSNQAYTKLKNELQNSK